MQDRDRFLELLHEATAMIKIDNKMPKKDEVRDWFKGMDLTEEHYQYIDAYLRNAFHQTDDTSKSKSPNPKAPKTKKQGGSGKKSNYINAYLKEIRNITPLTEEEKVRMYRLFLSGDASVKNRLIEGNLSKVLTVAKRFQTGMAMEEELLREELMGEGNLALISAIDTLRSNDDLKDKSLDDKAFYKKCEKHITNEIKKSLTSYLKMEVGLSDLERSIVAKSALIHEATKHLAEETGTLANIHELSEYMGMSEEEIVDVVELSNGAIKIGD